MVVSCPKCGKKTALINNTCEHCGMKVKTCPECENIVEINQQNCDYCGFSFEMAQKESNNTEEIPKELKKTAVKLASFAEQENKKYHKISRIFEAVGLVFFILSCAITPLMLRGEDAILKIPSIRTIATLFLVLSAISIFVSSILKELRTIFSHGAIIRQMNALKFDYKKYYSFDKAGRTLNTTFQFDNNGQAQLVQAIRYKEDPSSKVKKLIKQLCIVACSLLFCIFAFIGIKTVNDAQLTAVMFGFEYIFKFNASLIIAIVVLAMQLVLDWFFDKDNEEVEKWMLKMKKDE